MSIVRLTYVLAVLLAFFSQGGMDDVICPYFILLFMHRLTHYIYSKA